jgi:hypothetical protein
MTVNKQHFWIDREHDRISTEIPCRVGPAGDNGLQAVIINLSAGGLKFACTREVFNLLLPEDQRIPGQVSDVEMEIQFQLHNDDKKQPLSVRTRARIIHTERLAQDSYTLGVQFIALNEADDNGIKSCIRYMSARTGEL